jgi:hypothetical protein
MWAIELWNNVSYNCNLQHSTLNQLTIWMFPKPNKCLCIVNTQYYKQFLKKTLYQNVFKIRFHTPSHIPHSNCYFKNFSIQYMKFMFMSILGGYLNFQKNVSFGGFFFFFPKNQFGSIF